MIATPGAFESFRVSSDRLPPAARLAAYSQLMDRTMEKAEIAAVGTRFSFDASVCRLPDLDVVCATAGATRVNRTRELTNGAEKLFLMALLEGTASVAQLGKDAIVSGGGAILFSAGAPLRMERTASRFFLIGIPRIVLEPMIADAGSALMSVIPGTAEPVRLLAPYLDLFNEAAIEAPELRCAAVNHIHDLVALAAGATSDVAEIAGGRSLPAARMRAIKADISRHPEADLTADALGARHGVSARYIHKLFRRENSSLSGFVLGVRLARAHRLLTEPRYTRLTIAALALDAGFGDVSTFNHHFRRHFGMTPSDVRALARGESVSGKRLSD